MRATRPRASWNAKWLGPLKPLPPTSAATVTESPSRVTLVIASDTWTPMNSLSLQIRIAVGPAKFATLRRQRRQMQRWRETRRCRPCWPHRAHSSRRRVTPCSSASSFRRSSTGVRVRVRPNRKVCPTLQRHHADRNPSRDCVSCRRDPYISRVWAKCLSIANRLTGAMFQRARVPRPTTGANARISKEDT